MRPPSWAERGGNAAAPPVRSLRGADDRALRAQLTESWQAARAAWPEVELDADVFIACLAQRLPGREAPAALSQIYTADLYLACACSDELDERLIHESRAMAQLAHPNVVAVFEISRFRGQVFLVMELVEGQPLGHWLRAAPRGWRASTTRLADTAVIRNRNEPS